MLKHIDAEKLQRQADRVSDERRKLKEFADNWVVGEWSQSVKRYRMRHILD